MLESDIDFFKDVIKVYEELTDLQCIICDAHGNIVVNSQTEAESNDYLCELLYDSETWGNLLKNWCQDFSKIRRLVLFDAFPGIKSIIGRIFHDGDTEYFLFAGFLLEKETKPTVKMYLEKKMNNPDKVNHILDHMNEYSQLEIQHKIGKINKLADVIHKWLLTQNKLTDLDKTENNLKHFLQLLLDDDVNINKFLQWFFNTQTDIDFAGYARKKNEDQFIIEDYLFSQGPSLFGKEFTIGEGFLGHAVAAQMDIHLNHVQNDPRIIYFQGHGVFPKAIFCFPIIMDSEVKGLFFGGSCTVSILETVNFWAGPLVAAYIKKSENNLNCQNWIMNESMKLKTFFGVLETFKSVSGIKELQLAILDYCIQFTRGSFASFMWLQSTGQSYGVVSKGLTQEQMDQYSNDISCRYFTTNESSQPENMKITERTTDWNVRVLEIPIIHHGECYGLLCIGLRDRLMNEEDLRFLNYLAYAGGLGILLLQTSNIAVAKEDDEEKNIAASEQDLYNQLPLSKREKEVVKKVVEGKNNREISSSLYISEHTVKNHLTNIFQKLNVQDRTQLITKIYQREALLKDR